MENSSMNPSVGIRVESPVIHCHSNSRGSHDILPLHQGRSGMISGDEDNDEISKASGSDGIGGEGSDNPRTQKLNSRNQRSDGDMLPRQVGIDGSTAVQESMNSTLPLWHQVVNCSIASLLGLAMVKFTGMSKDQFIENPTSSWSCLAALVMYFLTSLILIQFRGLPPKFSQFLKRVASASGAVSFLLLISLFLPKLPGLLLICASWALFVVISCWPTLESAIGWLHTKIKIAKDVVISFAKKLFTRDVNNQQQRPPRV